MKSAENPIWKCSFRQAGLLALIRRRLAVCLEHHIASCPRCRRRLADIGRVELALQLILTEPHSLTLLQQANLRALNMLCRQERFSPQADALRQAVVQPNWTFRHSRTLEKGLQAAACVLVVCLLKFGLISFFKDIQEGGEKALHRYYAVHLGEETAQELLEEPPQST